MKKLTYFFILILALTSKTASASDEKSCNDILSNQIEVTVRDLAQLRFELDLQLSQGNRSIITAGMNTAFERKRAEALSHFSSSGLSSEMLQQRIQGEIKKIQGVHLDQNTEYEQLKEAQAEEMDGLVASVSTLGELKIKVNNAAQVNLGNGKVLAVGGDEGASCLYNKRVQLINSTTGKTKLVLDLNHSRFLGPKAWKLSDGSVLVAGGGSEELELISADLKTSTDIGFLGRDFTEVKNAHGEGFLNDGSLLIVVEDGSQGGLYLFYQFDPVSKKVTELGRIFGFEANKAVSILPDGKVILSGGRKRGFNSLIPVSDIEMVDAFAIPASSKNWVKRMFPEKKAGVEKIGSLERPLFNHQQTVLQDGRILMIGGNSKRVRSEVGIFDPVLKEYRKIGKLSHLR